MAPSTLAFDPFVLDVESERLLRGREPIELRPKTWQLMRFLAENPGRLLTKDELLDEVWADVAVTPASLNQAIRELRQALGDDAREPRYIQTVHRRGFRFIAAVESAGPGGIPGPARGVAPGRARPEMVGREAELERLRELFARAVAGERQVVFVTGDEGIGKTTLLRAFLDDLRADPRHVFFAGGGQCVELLGAHEAYLPVLDALDRLTRDAPESALSRVLERYAPTWVAQLPWLGAADERELNLPLAGSPARMLREFCVAVEALSSERPLVVWLEDLHWCDAATVDIVSAVASRAEPARLMVIGTYRPVEVAVRDHPIGRLKRKLVVQKLAVELPLELLGAEAVESMIAGRFGDSEWRRPLSRLIHDHSDGNPLFVGVATDYMVSEGWLVPDSAGWQLTVGLESVDGRLADGLWAVVAGQLEGMRDEEVAALEAASVAGRVFSADEVAAALGTGVGDAEAVCGRLAEWGRFIEPTEGASWPDGSDSRRFQFSHAKLRGLLYGHLPPERRQRLHARIAARLERGFAGRHEAIAAELAIHHERAGNTERAIPFLVMAAEGVQRRFATGEAVNYLKHALDLLLREPESEARDLSEVKLRLKLARAYIFAAGYTGDAQAANIARALELSRRLGRVELHLVGLGYRSARSLAAGELDTVRELAEESRRLATTVDDPVVGSHFHMILASEAVLRGEPERAIREAAEGLEMVDGVDPKRLSADFPHDFAAFTQLMSAWASWLAGRPDEAEPKVRAGLRRESTPFGVLTRNGLAMVAELFRRDRAAVADLHRTISRAREEFGISWPYPATSAGEGWLLLTGGEIEPAIERMGRGIVEAESCGTHHCLTLLLAVLAEAHLARAAVADGLAALDRAVARAELGGERFWEAEIHRLRGELLRCAGDDEAAEQSFRRALAVARAQGALSLELRAATSLAELLRGSSRAAEARDTLSGVYGRFTEGFDTPDLVDARALLGAL
ncbi:MAG TPA: AAA family ATPase [Candidatus Sulfomarinibacteraceae bacterium]|nr:AAA family ATPase [Candidatus Sulfomarinibacteraceae bacterium]